MRPDRIARLIELERRIAAREAEMRQIKARVQQMRNRLVTIKARIR